jgi:hypothetical protein
VRLGARYTRGAHRGQAFGIVPGATHRIRRRLRIQRRKDRIAEARVPGDVHGLVSRLKAKPLTAKSLLLHDSDSDLVGPAKADIFKSERFHFCRPQHVPSVDHERSRHLDADLLPIEPPVLFPFCEQE